MLILGVLSDLMCVLSLKNCFPCVLFEKQNACPLCLFFSYQRDDEDGDDMDSYQVSLPSFLWHGAQLLLIASTRKAEGREEEGGAQSWSVQFFTCF